MKNKVRNLLIEFANIHRFLMRFLKEVVSPPFEIKEIIRQCYEIGWRSLPLISVTGFIVGFVFTKQSRPSLEEFGATSWLPSLISIAIIRALAPLVTALIASGKVGSQIGAELSSMNVTEQIDAMEVSGTNPFKFLIVSRVWATTIGIPILCFYTAGIGLLGGYLSIASKDDVSFLSFLRRYLKRSLIKIFLRWYSELLYLDLRLALSVVIVGIFRQKELKVSEKQQTVL